MTPFVITTDSTCDLPAHYLQKHHISIIPLHYELDGIEYGEGLELPPAEFYKKMRSGMMPITNAIIPETAKNLFIDYVRQGIPILHIAFSSGLSSSYANSVLAANDLKEEYPDAVIYVVDSLSASLGEGLLVHKAVKLQESGASIEEAFRWLEDHKVCICHNFTVDDLNHLFRGGRISKTTAVLGSLINIKPILHVDDTGHLIAISKTRGRKKSLTALVDRMAEQISGFENDTVFISHGDAFEDASYVGELVKERFGIQDILINYVCPTIGAHSGPGTIALFFMGSPR